jgi:hypothetical protein
MYHKGRDVPRLAGQMPDYDVFISYRVSADADLAELLYERLTKKKLNVYMDKFCLAPGNYN